MGTVIVGDIEDIVNNEDENKNDINENYEFNNEDVYEKILKSMTKYNLQYDKFNTNNIFRNNFENTKTNSNITYVASSPIPIPYIKTKPY